MKKLFSFLLVLLALFTVSACIGEAPIFDDDDEIVMDTEATYFTSISETVNLNPYSETLANANTLYSLLTDSLYIGDYDWDLAIELGLAEEVGDFTNTALLPFGYFPRMAVDFPEDVTGRGTHWRFTLRQDLEFEDGTPIDAHTFEYSWRQLLDPLLLNARASNLYDTGNLPLVNAEKYFTQLVPDVDELGFVKYYVNDVEYTRANSRIEAGEPYFYAQSGLYEDYFIELFGTTWYLGTFIDDVWYDFWTDAAGNVLAPDVVDDDGDHIVFLDSAGNRIPNRNMPKVDDEGDPILDDEGEPVLWLAAAYATGFRPAYMDAAGDRAIVDSAGIPVDGEERFEDAVEIPWEDVGFEVISEYVFEIRLSSKKSAWQVMTNLSSGITGVVHPENYEDGKIEGDTRTTYGTIDNPLVSYGPYNLIEWVDGGFFLYERNDDHYASEDYRIKRIRYDVINDQSTAVNEFRQGRLDVTGVGGEYYEQYRTSPYLKLSPATLIFRFEFSIDRPNPDDNNVLSQYAEFRQALYFAVDRETFVTDVRAPGFPTHGFLGPIYFASEQNPFSYRASQAGQGVLAPFSPATYGYNPVMAKSLYDQAYAKAVADGYITQGQVVDFEFVFFNAETNWIMANWLKATTEAIFGPTFNMELNAVTSPELTGAGGVWDSGNHDITFAGWQGLQFWAPGMLQVYSSNSTHFNDIGFETGNVELSVELPAGKLAVQEWLADLLAMDEEDLTAADESYIDSFQTFLSKFEGDVYTDTYHRLIFFVYYNVLDYDLYEGREDEFDAITATLEAELLRQMIGVPLFTSVSAAVYSARVVFEAQEYHARMGWGGLRYMYLKK
ncbi:MAG: hypothetical protein EA375_04420 [Acholeplasmataceae bacterium]|nr:MAG: hypothetical protein EA375_04420 [Acholeplasmataceae bacterium]